jgi:hypothetical protein
MPRKKISLTSPIEITPFLDLVYRLVFRTEYEISKMDLHPRSRKKVEGTCEILATG